MSSGIAVRKAEASVATRAEGDAEPSANANGMPTMYGHFGVFDVWTEIDSWYEGNFMERIAAGAYKKTFREITPKALFQHGCDPQIGDKVMGVPNVLREDPQDGPFGEVPLLDTSYNRDLVPGLEIGAYGASFRFSVMREDWVEEPGVSDHNPKGLPERTIKELRCSEFGPCTWPAYAGASLGVRSMTDEWIAARMTTQPESQVRAVLAYLEQRDARPTTPDAGETTDDDAPAADEARDITTSADDEVRDTPEQEPPADEATAPVKDTTDPKTAAPERSSTPLYTGKKDALAAPGSPTPLYIGNNTRKEWEL